MNMLNELFPLLLLSLDWLQTPDGSNAVFAVICMAALIGLPAQA